ncbi:hypothetical protein NC653_008139 [Populus alba x Populus x berolinensis]|uniref:Leucine-rich repeat-containing N-terminal plant-type domain-containing protein n=1 Tax=Populus alba x Populus x berolinensis TaxID=444605 RepID=A0AAD6W885_9ROSI|nr:hypothetical protein NC653_008139 [Populus alba x Populus x berolinensis]
MGPWDGRPLPSCGVFLWDGIECGSSTGRVTALDLWSSRNWKLGDRYLNASLFLPFQELKVCICLVGSTTYGEGKLEFPFAGGSGGEIRDNDLLPFPLNRWDEGDE